MKDVYKIYEGAFLVNKHEKDSQQFHVFSLVFADKDSDGVYECHFRDEYHLLSFIEMLTKTPGGD